MLQTFVVVAAAGLGACVGSFLNVVIYRLPAGRSLGGRSHCPQCNVQIPWSRNIPVLGWLLLGGRSSCCKQRIAVRYPLVELLTAVMFALLFWATPFAPITRGETLLLLPVFGASFQALFLSLLIACSFIDMDHRILPDAMTKPGMALGVVACFLVPGLAGFAFDDEQHTLSPALDSVLTSLLGLIVGFGVIWLIRVIAGRVFKREAMGFGDVKFLGMIGAFLGWRGALLSLFLACVLGAVIGSLQRLFTKDSMIPFGPFLALGAVASLFGEKRILEWMFVTWPEWQRGSPAAPYFLLATSVLALLALFLLVRRGRRNG